MDASTLLSVNEAAEQLSCSPQYVRKLLRTNELEGAKKGDTWLIPMETLNKFFNSGKKIGGVTSDQVNSRPSSKKKMKALSFFSGAMGLDLGLENFGIETVLACEFDKASRDTIIANKPNIGLIGDILNYSATEILEYSGLSSPDEVDIIVGGPPCQAFSTAGKRLGFQDKRGNVFLKYLEIIESIKPRYVVIENVRGLLSSAISIQDEYLQNIEEPIFGKPGSSLFYVHHRLVAAGYNVTFNLYNSANFGAPQIRERVVLIATLDSIPVPYLLPTHDEFGRFGLMKWKTFGEAVSDLSEFPKDFVKYPEKRLKYLKMLGPGQNWRNLPSEVQQEAMGKSFHLGGGKTGFYRRLDWHKPSPTVVTHPAMPATELAHPTEDRPLSVQEYKRIQQFPDSWKICGKISDQYKQIGNAVPVGLGEAIAKTIVDHSQGTPNIRIKNFPYSRYKFTGNQEFLINFHKQLRSSDEKIKQLKLTLV
jgi:DNA (cytosine-5)-methyltransferase 1